MTEKEVLQYEKTAGPQVLQNKASFQKIGTTECQKMDAAYNSLRGIVDDFRTKKIYLDDTASIITASIYIADKHDRASVATIDRYVSNLRQLLRSPPEIFPANPSITVSLPAWQTVGDQVDVLVRVKDCDELRTAMSCGMELS